MEAKELMIRDWAQSPDLVRPAQYSGRFLDFQPLDGEKYRRLEFLYEDGNCGMHIPEKRVYPIPLTEEFFKKNGFSIKEGGSIMGLAIEDTFTMNIDDEYGQHKWSIIITDGPWCVKIKIFGMLAIRIVIHSVHDLQHALRLVGLNEMADNLKV